jgi:hypothetical protein
MDSSKQRSKDVEKDAGTTVTLAADADETGYSRKPLWNRILNWGVEEVGITPIPLTRRTDTRYFNLFTMWFTALLCPLP